jgi:hypothetical protein
MLLMATLRVAADSPLTAGEKGVGGVVGSDREHKNRQNARVNEVTLSDEDRRLVALWAADCAERVLPLFEAKAPSDTRPRKAIEGTRPFAIGAGGQGNFALLPGRLTQPHARSAIRLPQPPLVSRPTQRRPLTSTHWRPLTR